MRRGRGRRWGLMLLALGWSGGAHSFLINEWEPVVTTELEHPVAVEPVPGKPWTEPVSGMELVWIPPGCFKMGSPPQMEGRDADEGPVHQLCLEGFWMGRHEVTQGEWERVVRNNPAHFRKGDDYPVERVSREDVEWFLNKLNHLYPGKVMFRLPTEGQWEYVCRNGGEQLRYAGGNDYEQVAWHRDNSNRSTQPVEQKRPNRLGVFDLSGNLWEWTNEIYSGSAYLNQPGDPVAGEGGMDYWAIRGGGWNSLSPSLRCTNRGFEHFAAKLDDLGLRVVRVIDTTAHKRKDIKEISPF